MTASKTPITDALVASIEGRGGYSVRSEYAAEDFQALSRKLETDRAALIAALEAFVTERESTWLGPVGPREFAYHAARATLARVRS